MQFQTAHPPIPARAIFFLSLAAFAAAATARLCDPLLPLIASDFGVTTGQAASVVTAFALTYGLLQAFFGPAGDRFGKYRVILLATTLSIATSLACAFAGSLQALALLRLASGASSAAIIPLAMAWIGDVVAYDQRQGVLGRFLTGQMSGLIFGQAAGGVLGEHFGWRAGLASLSLLYLIAACGLAFEYRINPKTRPAPPAQPVSVLQAWANMAHLTRRPWVRIILLTVFIEGMTVFGPLAFVGASLHERFGIGLDQVGLIIGFYGIGGLCYTFLVGRLIGLVGERGLALGGGLIMGLAFATLAFTPSLWGAGLATAFLGFGFYALHATMQTHATQMAPEARGSAVALFASCYFVGQSLGVYLVSLLVDHYGAGPAFLAAALGLPALGFWFAARLVHRAGLAETSQLV